MKESLNISGPQASSNEAGFIHRRINPFASLGDVEIWETLKEGDQKALGFIYNEYLPHLFRFGCQFSSNRELVKDCIQDIFIAIGSRRESSAKVHSIKAYLFKTLYREIIRKQKKNRYELFEDNKKVPFEIDLSIESLIIKNDQYNEKLEKIKKGLNKLTDKQRQVILHYYYDGFTYDEIADVMGIQHKNTIAKLISRAIEMLKNSVISLSLLWAFQAQNYFG